MHLDLSHLEGPSCRVEHPFHLEEQEVTITAGRQALGARFAAPGLARGAVVVAHASGSRRLCWRGRFVTAALARAGLATLLVDLLTEDEDDDTPSLRADVPLLAERLVAATDWLGVQPRTAELPVGYFGDGAAAAGAIVAAARRPEAVRAIVSHDGRPDLGGPSLALEQAATLLVVGADGAELLDANRFALARLRGEARLEVVEGTTRDGAGFDRLTALARDWFARHLVAEH